MEGLSETTRRSHRLDIRQTPHAEPAHRAKSKHRQPLKPLADPSTRPLRGRLRMREWNLRSILSTERNRTAGFTLVELLVVLVILGLVMGLVGPRVLGYLSSSRERTMRLQIESFASALDLFYIDAGRYPSNAEGLDALIKAPTTDKHWAGPYLKQPKVPDDPWGNAYEYHVPGKATPYSIVSLGPSGKAAAPGDRADAGQD